MGDLDLNEIGRASYKMLINTGSIPNKDKSELTLIERNNLINDLTNKLKKSVNKLNEDNHKYEFLSYLYLSTIMYLNNADLNKYIKISTKN